MEERFVSKNRRLLMSNFKLNALLDITLAINENLPVSELLAKYEVILKEDLEIEKILIFKLNEQWETILNFGFDKNFEKRINVEKDLLDIREISPIGVINDPGILAGDVDIIIPVIHKEKSIAYVLIGDIDEEGEGISPIIKHLRFIQTLSNILVVAIENIRLIDENLRQVAIKRELELASKMQNMLIPSDETLPSNEHVQIKSFYHPHYDVGGDYYDVIELSENDIGFCIADVSGKGMSAAILMSNFQANLRALFTKDIKLEELVSRLNERVLKSANGEKFITLFIARYSYDTKKLQYINSGHNPPLAYDVGTKKLFLLKNGSVGIGMLDALPFTIKTVIDISNRTKILCYTDGLVELIQGDGIGYGTDFIESELANEENIERNINSIISHHNILEGNSAVFDDISILGLEFTGL
jgi:sigma-B regulation protein RsbU (phosphoserine phosphatase)